MRLRMLALIAAVGIMGYCVYLRNRPKELDPRIQKAVDQLTTTVEYQERFLGKEMPEFWLMMSEMGVSDSLWPHVKGITHAAGRGLYLVLDDSLGGEYRYWGAMDQFIRKAQHDG